MGMIDIIVIIISIYVVGPYKEVEFIYFQK
jgi:hypothetical protein